MIVFFVKYVEPGRDHEVGTRELYTRKTLETRVHASPDPPIG